MTYTKSIYQIALTQLYGFGPIKTKQLLTKLNNEKALFKLSLKELSSISGISLASLQKMNREKALEKALEIVKQLKKFQIEFLFYTDPKYPRRLKQCEDAPLIIYTRGTMDLNNSRFVSVVGTRDISDYGKRICAELIQELADTNIVVVSGMAYGIDIEIHKRCLEHQVSTIGVMAHGLERVYPHLHRATAKKMLEQGGLISEYPPNTNPDKENFPMRNRIVAGLCDATIVLESKEKGGSLITANLANDYNRDVFAYPGSVFEKNSEGCNLLIENNRAHLIRNGSDFLKKMGWDSLIKKPIQRSIFHNLSQEEQNIVQLLEHKGQANIDEVSMQLKIPTSQLNVLLFQLEMNGVVASLPGNRCRLV